MLVFSIIWRSHHKLYDNFSLVQDFGVELKNIHWILLGVMSEALHDWLFIVIGSSILSVSHTMEYFIDICSSKFFKSNTCHLNF